MSFHRMSKGKPLHDTFFQILLVTRKHWSTWLFLNDLIHLRNANLHSCTGRGARGAAALPNFRQLRFFGQQEKISQSHFLKTFLCFFFISLKRQIFSILI